MPDKYLAYRNVPFPVVATALGIDVNQYRRSKDEFVGACPIHQSKTNKNCFRYHDDGRYNCFSQCCKGKGALDFTRAVRQCSFTEAVAFLEPLIGQGTAKEAANEKSSVMGHSEASGELKPFVGKYEKFAKPSAWLQARCPDEAVLKRFGVFYYENNALKSAVNGHVLLPIRDLDGVCYGYLARNIGEVTDTTPKYRLPAQLPKSRFLFGSDQLHTFGTLPLKYVFLVESPLCCLHFASLGIPCVAAYGWAVSDQQLDILCQVARGVVYIADKNKFEDSRPQAARIAARLWVKAPPLPEGVEDPEQLDREAILALLR